MQRPDTIRIWLLRIALWAAIFAAWRLNHTSYTARLPELEQRFNAGPGAPSEAAWYASNRDVSLYARWRFWRRKEAERRAAGPIAPPKYPLAGRRRP